MGLIKGIMRVSKNTVRRIKKAPDYVVFVLDGSYPDIKEPKKNFIKRKISPPKQSLEELNEGFKRVMHDPRVRGVVLHLRSLSISFSQVEELRSMVKSLRENGKHVIAWSQSYDTKSYYLACAADEIYLQRGGDISNLGLKQSFTYLAKAFNKVGISMEVVNISPYKSAADTLSKESMSKEVREMTNWLLESTYKEIVTAISRGRKISEVAAKEIIENSPYIDKSAVEKVVDKVLNEEELPIFLGTKSKPCSIMGYKIANKYLMILPLKRQSKHIALIRVQGNIVSGKSSNPPFKLPIPLLLNRKVGDLTVVQQVRKATQDKRVKAVLLYIDSGGGSANASEAMASALESLAQKKPLVAVMGSAAASGGYYVATPAHWIVAQPSTITGSIGVISAKIVNKGLLDNLLMNRESIKFGSSMDLQDPEQPYSDEERNKAFELISNTYDVFLDRVSKSRSLTKDEVDAIGGGRVWTGSQALEKGLVDELGGLSTGLNKIYKLTGLNNRYPLVEYKEDNIYKSPIEIEPTSTIEYALESINELNKSASLCIMPFIRE